MKRIAVFCFVQLFTALHSAPSIESCPKDSVLVKDTCKCDHDLCTKPPCLFDLVALENGTDEPGNCCGSYECVGCPRESLLQDKCPCAAGAVLDPNGECKCIDPHQTLSQNNTECVCNPNLCELPQVCAENHVPVSTSAPGDCCPTTKCIKCPDDSFATNNEDTAIEDKCVCYPCPNECGPGEQVVIIQKGSGFPGGCCDMYKCESALEALKKNTCVVENATYSAGERWETVDGQNCTCQDGISFCIRASTSADEARSCHNEGNVYKHAESWMQDSCTNCTCFDGVAKCIAHMCEVHQDVIKKPDCPAFVCNKQCADGYRVNRRGCNICKCNTYYDDLLQQYNISRNDLKEILDERFATSTTPENGGEKDEDEKEFTTDSSDRVHVTTPLAGSDGSLNWHAIVWPSLVASLLSICIVLGICYCYRNHGNKGSYDTNPPSTIYERVKLTKDTLYNNNYIGNKVHSKIIKENL